MNPYLNLSLESQNIETTNGTTVVNTGAISDIRVALEQYNTVCNIVNALEKSTQVDSIALESYNLMLGNISEFTSDVKVSVESLSADNAAPTLQHALELKVALEAGIHDWILETFKGPMKHLENAEKEFSTIKATALSLKGSVKGTNDTITIGNPNAVTPGSDGVKTLLDTLEAARTNNKIIYNDYLKVLEPSLVEIYRRIIETSRNTAWVWIKKALFNSFFGILAFPVGASIEINKFKKEAEDFRGRLLGIFSKCKPMGGGTTVQSSKDHAFASIKVNRSTNNSVIKGISKAECEKVLDLTIATCNDFLHLLPSAKSLLTDCRKATEHAWDEDRKDNSGIIKAYQRFMHYVDAHQGKMFHTGDYYEIMKLCEYTAKQTKAVVDTISHL